MWVTAIISVSLLFSPCLADIKELSSHFTDLSPDPRGLGADGAADVDTIPLDFHRENTVTSDLIFDGFEDDDYIDFDKILSEGSDDYTYVYCVLVDCVEVVKITVMVIKLMVITLLELREIILF